MQTIDALSEKIHGEADDKLRYEIENATRPLFNLLNQSRTREFSTITIRNSDEGMPHIVLWQHALEALKLMAFNLHSDKYRKEAVAAFMHKVESMAFAQSMDAKPAA